MDLHLDPKAILSQTPSKFEAAAGKRKDPEALRKTCQEFEALLTQSMLKGMRSTIPQGGLLEKNRGEELFEEMMDMELAKQSSQNQSMGIAEVLYRQLSKPSVKE